MADWNIETFAYFCFNCCAAYLIATNDAFSIAMSNHRTFWSAKWASLNWPISVWPGQKVFPATHIHMKWSHCGIGHQVIFTFNQFQIRSVTFGLHSDVLLGSTDYSTSLDMWGVGCIFVEMITGMPTFPGIRDTYDQLDKIFRLLGTPTEDTWSSVTHFPGYKPHKLGNN